MAIFDTSQEHPPDKVRRYIITTIVFIALVVGFAWYLLRFHTEVRTAKRFLETPYRCDPPPPGTTQLQYSTVSGSAAPEPQWSWPR